MTRKILTYEDLRIAPADIYEQMGYHDTLPDESTRREVALIINNVRAWVNPEFCYFVTRDLPSFEMGRIIERQLRDSEAYALFICTAGLAFEQYQQQLKSEDDMVHVFIADALGSVIAEKCADRMEELLQQNVDKLGWHHTNRFSPGYCGWHVSQQQFLFPLFEGNTCGVRLTNSSLMLPIKSVSGIIGLGPNVRHIDYSCGLCTFTHCYKRKLNPLKSRA